MDCRYKFPIGSDDAAEAIGIIPCVYFISDNEGLIKIGKTNNLSKRIAKLQTENREKRLGIVNYTMLESADSRSALEANLHLQFSKWRHHGEWFEEEPVVQYLLSVPGGFIRDIDWVKRKMETMSESINMSTIDYFIDSTITKLHAELIALGIKNKTIANWFGCTEQNVSQLWKNKSFSIKQYLTMQFKLNEAKEKQYEHN